MPRMSKAKRILRIKRDLQLLMDGTNCNAAKTAYPSKHNCELCDRRYCEFATGESFHGYHCLVVIADEAVDALISKGVFN